MDIAVCDNDFDTINQFHAAVVNGVSPSMSRAGNPLDNASMENLFAFERDAHEERVSHNIAKPVTHQEACDLIHDYIHFYNNHRLCLKTKLTPFEKRCQSA